MSPAEASTDDENFIPKEALRKISASLDQPDKFAEIFCTAAKTQKSIDTVLKDVLRDLLKNDEVSRSVVKDLLREVEKEDWRAFVRKGFGGVGALILIGFGALLTALIDYMMK